MSIEAVSWAINLDANLTPTTKLLLVCLANYADADGECFPGVARLAGQVGVSSRQVRRLLDELDDRGLLDRTRRRRSNGNLGTYLYRLGVGFQPPAIVPEPADEPPADTGDQGTPVSGGTSGHPRPDQRTPMSGSPADTHVRAEPSVPNPSVNRQQDDGDDDPTGRPPQAKAEGDEWYGRTLADWTYKHHPDLVAELHAARTLADAYRALLDVVAQVIDDSTVVLQVRQVDLLLEYLERATGVESDRLSHRRLLNRMVATLPAGRALDLLAQAVSRGAGTADEYADDQLGALLRYAGAIDAGERAALG